LPTFPERGLQLAIAEIGIIPLATPGPGVADYIADAVALLERRGVRFEVTAMGRIIEGDVDAILDLAREMHEVTFGKDVRRAITTITIDDRSDREASARHRVEAVRGRLTGRGSSGRETRTRD
jgi:uncharacterized protein (TIGR00106 family)